MLLPHLLCTMDSVMAQTSTFRVALVHDWLTGMRGGEKVLEVLCELFPQATLFTLLHNPGSVSSRIEQMQIRTSFLQHVPFRKEKYRSFLPLFPKAIESFDLTGFDLILSTSHAVAKGAVPGPDALHICYCHTPMRYVWELYDEYFGPGRSNWPTRLLMKRIAPKLREWDVRTSSRVHYFVANSKNVAKRIQAYYQRTADVIHAPVDASQFVLSTAVDDYYLIVSALVPYKRVDLAIEVFNRLGKRLVIVGKGPEQRKLESMAGSTIEFLGWQDSGHLVSLYGRCKALIFPGVEDFGIVPLEAMACGKPVIAFAAGGALETVVEGKTGVYFDRQDPSALEAAVKRVEQMSFDAEGIRRHSLQFNRPLFKEKINRYIHEKVEEYPGNRIFG